MKKLFIVMLVLCIALCSCSKNENDVKPESDTPISDKNESKITIACTQDVQVLVSDGLNTAGIDTVKLIDAGNEFISRGFMLDVASDRIPDILITGDIRQFINYAELGYFFPVAYDGIKDAAPCAYSKMMETSVYDKLCTWNKKHNYGIILRTDYADMQICINNNLIDDFVSVRELLTRNKPDSGFSLIDLPFRSPDRRFIDILSEGKVNPYRLYLSGEQPISGIYSQDFALLAENLRQMYSKKLIPADFINHDADITKNIFLQNKLAAMFTNSVPQNADIKTIPADDDTKFIAVGFFKKNSSAVSLDCQLNIINSITLSEKFKSCPKNNNLADVLDYFVPYDIHEKAFSAADSALISVIIDKTSVRDAVKIYENSGGNEYMKEVRKLYAEKLRLLNTDMGSDMN